jgi:hypothetical protein
MKNFVILIVVVAVVLGGYFFFSTEDSIQDVGLVDGQISYESQSLGIGFDYLDDKFELIEDANKVVLQSAYVVVENPSGIQGNESKHSFSIGFEVIKDELFNTMKNQSESAYSIMFPEGVESGLHEEADFSSYENIANKQGYSYSEGVEGINQKHIFLPMDSDETLVITFSYITDFLRDQATQQSGEYISEKDQKELFQSIIETLKFTN